MLNVTACSVSLDSVTLWAVAGQNTGVAKYWSGLPFPPPGDLPKLELNLCLLHLLHEGGFFTAEPPGSLHNMRVVN